jgi:preprotein translocase subunit SecG
MIVLLTIIHVAVCLFLILVVLLQTGKGADLAGAFGGGGSQTAFGARGATTLLHKITTGSAVVFMATSLILAIVASNPSTSVVQEPAGEAAPAPAEGTPLPVEPTDPGAAAEPDASGTPVDGDAVEEEDTTDDGTASEAADPPPENPPS